MTLEIRIEVPDEVGQIIKRWHAHYRAILDGRGDLESNVAAADYLAAQIETFAGRRLRAAYLAELRRLADERRRKPRPEDDPDRGP